MLKDIAETFLDFEIAKPKFFVAPKHAYLNKKCGLI